MAGSPQDRDRRPGGPEGTRLESVEEIRQAIQGRRPATVKEVATQVDTTAFRPARRPPTALLCLLDDGREEGELVRLRADRTVIGRTEGDIQIPHDSMISGTHAEITRELEQGRYRWYLTDLQSTNGTYVRTVNAVMKHTQELLIGSHRYRFDAAAQGAALNSQEAETMDETRTGTRGWASVSPTDLVPSLVELAANKTEGQRYFLNKPENWIGRNPNVCNVVIANDLLISPQHARLHRDAKGRWHIENTKSLNGTWLRVERMAMDMTCQFQIGEQRFLLRIF